MFRLPALMAPGCSWVERMWVTGTLDSTGDDASGERRLYKEEKREVV
jgi:hypothetical protein